MYALVYKGRVINGPRTWDKYQFEGALEKEGIFFQVGRGAPPEDQIPIIINDDAKILYARYIYPEYNPRTQGINGPYWEYTTTEAIGSFTVDYQPIGYIRLNLKAAVADNRWKRETSGVEVTIQNTTVRVSTAREDRNQFELLRAAGADNVSWKFDNNLWLTLTSADIATLADAVNAHVQSAFDWEQSVHVEIDAAQTPEELEAIDVGDPVPEQPQQGG